VWAGWTCAIDDIHVDQRRKGRPVEGISKARLRAGSGMGSRRLLRYSNRPRLHL
jgi:hypothetical protein